MKIKRYFKFQYLKILRLNDVPDKIAKGVGLGVGLDFLPIPFVSLVVAYVVARLARFNAVAAVGTVAVLKGLLWVFYPMNIFVGKMVLGHGIPSTVEKVAIVEPGLSLAGLSQFFTIETLSKLGKPFLVGSGVNALVFGFITFIVLRRILRFRHTKRKERRTRRLREKMLLSGTET